VALARDALADFATSIGAGDDLADRVRLATSEAVTNAVVHAYARCDGGIHVTAWLADDELCVLIADDGCGLRPRADNSSLGLGLTLIAELSNGFVAARRAGGGTELRMRFTVPGAATGVGSLRGSAPLH
jgi:stage II sporulation protein AB (anti-sigma F factor)